MSEVSRRLKAMVAEANMSLDSTSKSLRGYSTRPHEMFLERIRQHYPDLGAYKSIRGKTFTYEADSEGLSGSQFVNAALQSFYEQEAIVGKETNVIYPKISKRTLTGQAQLHMETMRHQVESWVSDVASSATSVASFRELAIEELGNDTVTNLFDDFRNSSLAQGILNHLMIHNWTFPAHLPVKVEGRPSPIGSLTMKSKYYISRDDNRAYCQDRHKLRLLAGACLHRLVHLKSKVQRQKLHVSTVVRAKGKDELRLSVPAAHSGCMTLLITGDISNFTGSLANSWLMLFALALDLDESLRNKFSLMSIGPTCMYATWFEIIAVYLYLTVGADCYVEETERYEYLSGGFLGVTANITTGLLCLSLVMIDLTRRILPQVVHTSCQAGGDDFAFLLVVRKGQEERVSSYIRRDMQDHIGLLKEFEVTYLDNRDNGIIEGVTFCRKRVILVRSNTHTLLRHEPSCPLPESILPYNTTKRLDLQIRAWRELDLDLLRYEGYYPDMLPYTDAIREVFLGKYPNVQPTRSETSRYWPQSGLVGIHENGILYTKGAYEAIAMVGQLDVGLYIFLATRAEKTRRLQVAEVIQSEDVYYKGELVTCYFLVEEGSKFTVERRVERISVRPDPGDLDSLYKILA